MSPQTSFREQKKVLLAGSERQPFSEHPHTLKAAAAPPPFEEPITVSVVLRRKAPIETDMLQRGKHLSREQFAEKHGVEPAAIDAVRAFASEYGLHAEQVGGPARRIIHLTGPQQAMEEAFGVTLLHQQENGKPLRLREGPIYVPESLAPYVDAVLGLDTRPQAKPHCRVVSPHRANGSFTPPQIAQLYGFPANARATGQTIGLIELGGGFREADLTAYFQSINVTVPKVSAVAVDSGRNAPGDANGADGEVMLDIEVAAGVAPGAAIAVYFAPNTDKGFLDAIATAIHDTTNKPTVISISWGGPESSWTPQAMKVMDEACQAAAALGITITVACGDDGATDGVAGSGNHVDFPASSPHVLACGGTKVTGSGTKIQSEVVWNELAAGEGATGGGVSAFFGRPSWQANVAVPRPGGKSGRGVPDVAGDADPTSGYVVRVDGQTSVIGGTSAVAPLWAGLLALANASHASPAGFVNPVLYGAPNAFHDITKGDNGGFKAAQGWDPCTGMGSPKGDAVIQALA